MTLRGLGILECKVGYQVYDVLGQTSMGDHVLDAAIVVQVASTGVVLVFLHPLC